MPDYLPYETLTIAAASLAATGMVTMAALRGWQGWLTLKLRELERRPATAGADSAPADVHRAARIELADLKERVRQLEAIAAGVDL
ncbi:hypothetical protein [Croceicoccus sp. BE223]|uniref:hypothetical protein n=1 Tax=Croceicoccus sp. BE223 TaxID=2817716 RepID=UPI0028646E33|nr:hypothetical protein [Croceicoccus sp. BE223]MDR7103769.1 hypothetical protein [Croceicoccus sp. BE223]